MSFREFEKWCNDRAFDGCWGMCEAIICIGALNQVRKHPFWRREKVWREEFREFIEENIVKLINQMIEEEEIERSTV